MKLGEKRKREKIHVFVATPAYDGKVDSDYSQSLAEAAYCSPLYGVNFTAGVMGNGAFIEMARNVYVKMFLEDNPDCTHLFFIDADLRFHPNAFIGLLKSGLPICAGMYRRRQPDEDYPVQITNHPEVGGLWVEDGWIMCNRVPTGFLCISRQVLEEMAEDAEKISVIEHKDVPWIFETKITDDKKFMGEDFAFCDKYVEKYQQPIPVWPGFEFKHGGYECCWETYIHKMIEKKKEDAA